MTAHVHHLLFVLSPAHTEGRRAKLLLRDDSNHPLALALRLTSGARLGDVFTFMSQLYFRGKRAYAVKFTQPPADVPGVLVIVPGRGLVDIATRVTLHDLLEIAATPIDVRDPSYNKPLVRDVHDLATKLTMADRVVFLGSVATNKYLSTLSNGLGARLYIPSDFVGLGSMSRGSKLLRCVDAGCELDYTPVARTQLGGAS